MPRPIKKEKKEDDSKLFAFLATFLSIIGFIIALIAKKDDKYVMHYAKQSLVIFIVFIIAIIGGWLPFIGVVVKLIINIIGAILWIISWIYALSGEFKKVPLIGDYAEGVKV